MIDTNRDTFCPLLWKHVNTHPDGSVSFCCISNYNNNENRPIDRDKDGKIIKSYDLNKNTIADVLNSENYRKARAMMLVGERHPACMKCYSNEDLNAPSYRSYNKVLFSDFTIEDARRVTNVDGSLIKIEPSYFELRLSNVCNLQCVMCDPTSSSKWRSDYKKLKDLISFPLHNYHFLSKEQINWSDDNKFWNDLLSYSQNFKMFSINGGEPLMLKKHIEFLKLLINHKRTNVSLRYNTNTTMIDEEIIELWNHFDHVEVSCSIDDLEERNTYIRWQSDWNNVISTFDRLTREKFDVIITQTISCFSYQNVINFHEFFRKKYPSIKINQSMVQRPAYLSPDVLPPSYRLRVRDEIYKYFTLVNSNDIALRILTTGLNNPNVHPLWNKTKEFVKAIDELHGISIIKYLPEFEELLKI